MNIYTLDLNFQNTPHNIAAYLVVGPHGPILIESGPGSTLQALKTRLAEHDFQPPDVRHVLLTHIHLDHAGAAGWWAQQGAQVYVHHVGAPHLIDPSKLLSSAKRIYLDKMDKLWGEMLLAPAERVTALHDGARIDVAGLELIALDTPGHAYHHFVYRLGDVAFTGDAAGIRVPNNPLIAIPAPPPEFDLEAWRNTLARLKRENFDALYPTHFGRVDNVVDHLDAMSELLEQSAEFVRRRMQSGMLREALIQEYEDWQHQRAEEAGVSPSASDELNKVSSHYISVDGLMRYWSKRGVG